MNEAAERWVLELAADRIERVGWTRGRSEHKGRLCVLGAISTVVGETETGVGQRIWLLDAATDRLRKRVGPFISLWNDTAKSRTVVLRALRSAARDLP